MRCTTQALMLGVFLGMGTALVFDRSSQAQTGSPAPTRVVAEVNGEKILLEEVDAVIKQRLMLQPPTTTQLRQLRLEILTGMIDEKIMRQFLKTSGPKIAPAEVEKQFTALEAAQKAQGKTLAEYMKETNQTEAQIRENLLMLLQLDKYVQDNINEKGLMQYYQINKDYFDKVTVRTSHIVIRLGATPTETEKAKARQKLQDLRANILAGKVDFATAAKEHSQCPSAPKGGDIGFIFRKWQNVDEAYARAAFAMKVGEVSDVIETEFGMHLIKVTERKEGKPSKFEECKEEVRDSYTEELRQALLTQLRKKSKVEITLP